MKVYFPNFKASPFWLINSVPVYTAE